MVGERRAEELAGDDADEEEERAGDGRDDDAAGDEDVHCRTAASITRADDAFLERLHAVVMLAPDIDVDIFRERMREIGYRGIQSTSSPPAATGRSSCRPACMAGRAARHDHRLAALADLPVRVIDVTEVKGNDAHGNNTVQTSPLMSALFNGLEDFGPQTISDAVADPSLVEASVDAVGQATTIALLPLEPR